MKELTRAEEQVMQILWKMERAFVNDILDRFPAPRPAYNTVSTIIRILEKKQFVGHEAMGKSHQYFPLVSKKEYAHSFLGRMVKGYFGNSYADMVSFFAQDPSVSLEEMEEIRHIVRKNLRIKRKN